MKDGKYEYDKLQTMKSIGDFRKDLWRSLNEYRSIAFNTTGIYESIHHIIHEPINSKVIKKFL